MLPAMAPKTKQAARRAKAKAPNEAATVLARVRSQPEPDQDAYWAAVRLFESLPEGMRKDNLRAWCEHLHKEGVSKEKTLVACVANVDTLCDIHATGDPGRRREVEAARMVSMLQEFMASGAHYDKELHNRFPLFRSAPPPGQGPESWDRRELGPENWDHELGPESWDQEVGPESWDQESWDQRGVTREVELGPEGVTGVRRRWDGSPPEMGQDS